MCVCVCDNSWQQRIAFSSTIQSIPRLRYVLWCKTATTIAGRTDKTTEIERFELTKWRLDLLDSTNCDDSKVGGLTMLNSHQCHFCKTAAVDDDLEFLRLADCVHRSSSKTVSETEHCTWRLRRWALKKMRSNSTNETITHVSDRETQLHIIDRIQHNTTGRDSQANTHHGRVGVFRISYLRHGSQASELKFDRWYRHSQSRNVGRRSNACIAQVARARRNRFKVYCFCWSPESTTLS